jgi:Ca2+-binding EF-hand superfamily protein
VQAAFSMFDISRTGFMNRKDFREALKKLQVLLQLQCNKHVSTAALVGYYV